jgi:hypothetical protein
MNMRRYPTVKRTGLRTLLFLALCAIPLSSPAVAWPESPDPLAGYWEWKGPVDAHKHHMEFTIWIDRDGDAIKGTYSVNEFVGTKWLGEDGNQTPFRGELRDGTISIEFDTTATVPGYEEHVTYKAPEDGRQPSTATIVPKGAMLEWTRVGGDPIEGIPDMLTLVRGKK